MKQRTIKFRAWDKETKVLHNLICIRTEYDEGDNILCYEVLTTIEKTGKVETFSTEELMQFTGLLDKNGKEIYEGDVVKFQMTRIKLVDNPVMTAFEDETAIYQGSIKWDEFGWRPFVDGEVKDCEIIGNIYENPDLIKSND